MGIMPPDREQKWQQIIRRFGLAGGKPGDEARPSDDLPKPAIDMDLHSRSNKSSDNRRTDPRTR